MQLFWTRTASFAFFLAASLPAAPAAAQRLSYGAKGGLDVTSVHFKSSFAPDTGMAAGVVAGGFVSWRLTSRLAVRGEGLVASQRAVFDAGIADTIRSLDVPVMLSYRAGSLAGRMIHVSGGL